MEPSSPIPSLAPKTPVALAATPKGQTNADGSWCAVQYLAPPSLVLAKNTQPNSRDAIKENLKPTPAERNVDRVDLHKTLGSFETVLVQLD